MSGGTYHEVSSTKHGWVQNSQITLDREVAFTINLDKSLQQLVPRNSDIFHGHPAIVLHVVTKFWTHVTSLDAGHMFMSLHVSDLDNEWAYTVVVSVTIRDDLKSCHDQCVVGISSKFTRPPFGGRHSWSIQYKFISFVVKDSGSFETLDIGTMTKLCLCIASPNIKVVSSCKPFGFLLVSGIWTNSISKHSHMHRS